MHFPTAMIWSWSHILLELEKKKMDRLDVLIVFLYMAH